MKPVFLLTDLFLFALVVAGIFYVRFALASPQLRANWRLALQRPAAAVSRPSGPELPFGPNGAARP